MKSTNEIKITVCNAWNILSDLMLNEMLQYKRITAHAHRQQNDKEIHVICVCVCWCVVNVFVTNQMDLCDLEYENIFLLCLIFIF